MKKILLILMGIMVLLLSSCGNYPVDFLANTAWESESISFSFDGSRISFSGWTLEFLGKGKVVWISNSATTEGTYAIIDDSNVSFNFSTGKVFSPTTITTLEDLCPLRASVYVSTMIVLVETSSEIQVTFKKQ